MEKKGWPRRQRKERKSPVKEEREREGRRRGYEERGDGGEMGGDSKRGETGERRERGEKEGEGKERKWERETGDVQGEAGRGGGLSCSLSLPCFAYMLISRFSVIVSHCHSPNFSPISHTICGLVHSTGARWEPQGFQIDSASVIYDIFSIEFDPEPE